MRSEKVLLCNSHRGMKSSRCYPSVRTGIASEKRD